MASSKRPYEVPHSTASPRTLTLHRILLDPDALENLCVVLRTSDVSHAVRIAIDRVLLAEEARVIRASVDTALENGYRLSPQLPVYLSPEDVLDPLDEED